VKGRKALIIGAICVAALSFSIVLPPQTFLIWNRTESAPKGLYWRSNGPLSINRWAVVSGKAPAAKWISKHGYLAPNWPIIKQVRGLPGDAICRIEGAITINDTVVATALISDSSGRDLPVWRGCFTVKQDEIFLLNGHPRSLDGRYFGPTKRRDILGTARLLWAFR